jgi:hypothetical protein
MKTTMKLLGIIALVAIIVFGLAACDDGSSAHVHNWGEWVLTATATCSAEGVETRVCALDAAHKETRPVAINLAAHNYGEWKITKAPTETEDGEETRTCAHNVVHKETRSIVMPNHKHDWSDWEQITAPTCTIAGVETRTCALNAAHKETRAVVALGHNWIDWTQTRDPTCYRPGVETATCTRDGIIGARTGEPINLDAHQWGEWKLTKAPTTSAEGVETRTCILYPAHKETRPIPALGGGGGGVVTPPTPPPAAPTFTSVADLKTWLSSQSANSASTPYTVKLDVADITGIRDALGNAAGNKYVILDLSGSTITDIPNQTFYGTTPFGTPVLVSITLPSGLTSIGQNGFSSCDNLAQQSYQH